MKRIKRNNIKQLGIILLLSVLMIPISASATTLKEYEDQVAKYTAELENKKNQIAKNDQEIAQIQSTIKNIKQQINDCYNESVALQAEIDKLTDEIAEKKEQLKQVVSYMQHSSGQSTYLEYIFGASSFTDFIYRVAVSEQLSEYNKKLIGEYNDTIDKNNKKKTELSSKQSELTKLNAQLYSEQEKIEADSSQVEGTMPSVQGQIDAAKKMVSYYKAKGCKSNDIIGITCDVPVTVKPGGSGSIVGANGFRFPVVGGRITQYYGNNGHKGVDIGKSCGEPIYAVAAGRVYYVGSSLDSYGAKMVLIVHNVSGKLVFSQYAHLQGYNVSVGQDVTTNTIIGYMGNTGYSFGCHLHLEMSTNYGWNYNAVYSKYVGNIINPFSYVPKP